MDACQVFCPNLECSASGQTDQGNIKIHCRKRRRYRCTTCGKCFTERTGTMLEGLRKEPQLIVIVVTLLAWGCPLQAIVQAFGLDERTVSDWQGRAGKHCEKVHQDVIVQGRLDLIHVQADEIRAVRHEVVQMFVSTALAVMRPAVPPAVPYQNGQPKLLGQ